MSKIRVQPFNQKSQQDCCDRFSIDGHMTYASEPTMMKEACQQLEEHFRLSQRELLTQRLDKLLFYRLVQGGNVDHVSSILNYVKNNHSDRYNYILTGQLQSTNQNLEKKTGSCVRALLPSWLFFSLVMVPFFVITTPLFYFLHGLILSLYRQKSRTRRRIRLPLLFAALSNNSTMVKLFAEKHENIIYCADDEGNNVYHYLAEMSKKSHIRSLNCLQLLCSVFGCAKSRSALMEYKNSSGFTALELAIHCGSPLYFTRLLEMPGILKTAVLSIGEKFVFSTQQKPSFDSDAKLATNASLDLVELVENSSLSDDQSLQPDNLRLPSTFAYELFHYDVTNYERGDIGAEDSFLLTLFANRDLMRMTEEEVQSIVCCPLLMHWMEIERKSMNLIVNIKCFGRWIVVFLCAAYMISSSDDGTAVSWIILFWQTVDQEPGGQYYTGTPIQYEYSNANNSLNGFVPTALANMDAACGYNVSARLNIYSTNVGMGVAGLQTSVTALSWAIVITSAFIVITDICFRFVLLTRQFFYAGWSTGCYASPLFMARRVFVRPIMECYIGRQMSVFSACVLPSMIWADYASTSIAPDSVAAGNEMSFYHSMAMVFAVMGTCARFFALIYSFRSKSTFSLVNHFVLTLCRLVKFVYQFSVLFFGVALFFGTIFMLVVHDPACPANAYPPFDTWVSSMVAIVKLTLGDNQLPGDMTPALLLLWVSYIAITTIVMLSLITGISARIADQVLNRKMINIMLAMESLRDAIEAESYLYIVLYPVFKWLHRRRLEKERKMIVDCDSKGNIVKVLIELETALV